MRGVPTTTTSLQSCVSVPCHLTRDYLIGGIALVLVTTMFPATAIADEPVRKYIEDRANASLNVETLRRGNPDLHPLTLSLDRKSAPFIQTRDPDSLMACIPKRHADIELGDC